MQQVDHDNDGHEASDFKAFTHFAGHHLHELALAVRLLLRLHFSAGSFLAEDRTKTHIPFIENSIYMDSQVYGEDLEMIYNVSADSAWMLRSHGFWHHWSAVNS